MIKKNYKRNTDDVKSIIKSKVQMPALTSHWYLQFFYRRAESALVKASANTLKFPSV